MSFFAEKQNFKNEEVVCPVCKKRMTQAMVFSSPYNDSVDRMCQDCFRMCYKDKVKKRVAGIIDDSINLANVNKRLDCLEYESDNGGLFLNEGTEYTIPNLTPEDVKAEQRGFLILYAFFRLFFVIYKLGFDNYDDIGMNTSVIIMNCVFFVGALLYAVITVFRFISSWQMGCSKKRLVNLAITLLVYLVLAVFTAPIKINISI